MPFIHIKSLPIEQPLDVPAAIAGIASDFAAANDIPQAHVHVTWAYFQPGHFAKGDRTPDFQPEGPHSVLVDLLTPDFNSGDTIETMLQTLAASIATRTPTAINKIFINHRPAHSGMVFDDGEVVRW